MSTDTTNAPPFLEPENPQVSNLKLPPQSVEAEQAVLGGLMTEDTAWDNVAEILIPGDFYRADHQTIYQAMVELAHKSTPIDALTIAEHLNSQGLLDQGGGYQYLGDLSSNGSGSVNIEHYARLVKDRAILRRLITTANKIAARGYEPGGEDVDTILNTAEKEIFSIKDDRPSDKGPQNVNPVLQSAMDRIDELSAIEGTLTGLSTGYTDLDGMTSGWQKSDLIIVAGRPSMGKTAFAMNLVENALLSSHEPLLVFSLEMPAESLIFRMLSSLGRIDQGKIRTGKLTEDDWPAFNNAAAKLKDKPLYIDDSPGLSPEEMKARARRVLRESGAEKLGMIVVDYLQLMQIKGYNDNRVGEISEISRSLKLLARDFECPVIALSQLNRGLEHRPNKRPVMSDLRESGAIEQDADVIAFLYRDEVYNEDSPDKGMAEVIIGKQRNGPIGTVRLSFLGQFTRFENFIQPRYDQSYTHGFE